MLRLGGSVISTENAEEYSSAAKGESLEDTIMTESAYADVVVLRHKETGAAERAAALEVVPIINAGDGAGQHPTQALLDLYTIRKEFGRVDGLTIAFVGDLWYGRTVRSLAYLLAKFQVAKIIFVAPQITRIKDDIKDYLRRHGVAFEETENLDLALAASDVFYMTRIQREVFEREGRLDEYEKHKPEFGKFVITPRELSLMGPQARVLHPLPRVNEIARAVDSDSRAAYFRQVKNGLLVRMAVLTLMFSGTQWP